MKVTRKKTGPLFDYYIAFESGELTVYLHKLKSQTYPKITIGHDTGNMGIVETDDLIALLQAVVTYRVEDSKRKEA